MTPLRLSLLGFLAGVVSAAAAPVSWEEVSLLVRLHERESYIVQQVQSRLLLRPLTAQQQSALQAQGASEKLLQALRDPGAVVPPAEAEAIEAQRQARARVLQREAAAESAARLATQEAAAAEVRRADARASAATARETARQQLLAEDRSSFIETGTYLPAYGAVGSYRPAPYVNRFRGSYRPQPSIAPGLERAGTAEIPFRVSGPSGSGDRRVTPLSSSALFIPAR